jgi:hypothetical protein
MALDMALLSPVLIMGVGASRRLRKASLDGD